MKIAITGADKTGVTSIASLIGNGKVTFITEAATQALIAGFKLDRKVTREAELWMAFKQFETEQSAGEHFIADRCFVDIHAYADYFFHDDLPVMNVIGGMAYKAIESYDVVIHCPAGEFPIERNGIRPTSKHYQRLIDRRIKGTLALYQKDYYTVRGTLTERIKQVEEILKAWPT